MLPSRVGAGMTYMRQVNSEEAIRAALQRVLASAEFDASDRNRRFLKYIVEETLAGRANRIKAYGVAISVFGREETFDPQIDPIVRIEASRLRRSLERYHLTEGRLDAVRITVPKGGYVPAFGSPPVDELSDNDAVHEEAIAVPAGADPPEAMALPLPARPAAIHRIVPAIAAAGIAILATVLVLGAWSVAFRPMTRPAPEGTAAARNGPSIFVVPFEQEGDTAAFRDFGKSFTREVILALTGFENLFVFGPETAFRYGNGADLGRVASDLDVDFLLTGATGVSGDRFTTDVILVDAHSRQVLWGERFGGALGAAEILEARNEVANRVASALAQPYGVIFENRVKDTQGKSPETLTSYECVMRFYLYWKSYRREAHPAVRSCLEKAIVSDPFYAEAFSALSLVYSDADRFGFDQGSIPKDPRDTARHLAQMALELAPGSARAHQAMSTALWTSNDVKGSLKVAEAGLLLNPNDTELMAELGMHYAWLNQWPRALPLLHEAFTRNPGQPSTYRLPIFLNEYLHGRYEAALSEARRIQAPDVIYSHVAVAMAAGALGREEDARMALGRVLAMDPEFGDHVVNDLERRNIHPDLIRIVVDGLCRAGLSVPENPQPARTDRAGITVGQSSPDRRCNRT